MSSTPSDTKASQLAQQVLAPEPRGRRKLVLGVLALAVLGVLGYEALTPAAPEGARYLTQPVVRADMTVTVSAGGTLAPVTSVDVGSELSGTLTQVGPQENDKVHKGQVLAQLDTSKLRQAVVKSRAALQAAQATVTQTQATVTETRRAYERLTQLKQETQGRLPAVADLQAAEAAYARAKADEQSAQANVAQAAATLQSDETDLAKATIVSPVDGVVLSRKVEPGQSVAAGMTVPVLFTLAKDLTKMELDIKVDEADIATVKANQKATFTVSAWPGEKFSARVDRVGMGATTTDNVVTYKTVLLVDNSDLRLRPGLTAMAAMVTAQHPGVLQVPNASLRYVPANQAHGGGAPSQGILSKLMPHPPMMGQGTPTNKASGHSIWVQTPQGPQEVQVTVGLTNGKTTEVSAPNLQEGTNVILGEQQGAGK